MTSNRFILGITGGAGSGKSLVLEYLEEEYGAVILILDDMAKSCWIPGGACYDKVREIFGDGVFGEDGMPDRGMIAGIVFNDPAMLEKLNGAVHPEVRRMVEKAVKRSPEGSLIVIESAILAESGYSGMCDEIWYVYAPEDIRIKRMRETRGYSDDRIRSILENQLTEEEFINSTDVIIDNSGDFKDTMHRIDERMKNEILQHCKRQQR